MIVPTSLSVASCLLTKSIAECLPRQLAGLRPRYELVDRAFIGLDGGLPQTDVMIVRPVLVRDTRESSLELLRHPKLLSLIISILHSLDSLESFVDEARGVATRPCHFDDLRLLSFPFGLGWMCKGVGARCLFKEGCGYIRRRRGGCFRG